MGIETLFISVVYQPFLNVLVGIYWLLSLLSSAGSAVANPPPADMGVAVLIFTVVLRVLLLPLTIAGDRSEKERKELEQSIKKIETEYSAHPIELAQKKKAVFRGNARMMISALMELGIQIIIALMLWRIFAKGLTGVDLHLIYTWMPEVTQPFNLMFIGRYDLTHPDWVLNVLQTGLLFVLETLNMVFSPHQATRKEVIRMQLALPLVSFLVFAFLPAGKKLFVIGALSFSIVYRSTRILRSWLMTKFSAPAVVVAESSEGDQA